MTFRPIQNGVRVVHLGRVGSQEVVNTIGVENGAAGAVGDSLSHIAKSHGDAWRARIVGNLVNTYTHYATLAYSLEDQSIAPGDAGFTNTQAGGDTHQAAANSVCLVVSFLTAKRGRTFMGRTFLSPVPGNLIAADGATWIPAFPPVIQTAFNAYKADVDPAVGDNGRLAVCSHGSPSKGIPSGVEPVTHILVRPYIGTQRRRLR